jgi:aspartate carbamoyltransferase catalytic subunit
VKNVISYTDLSRVETEEIFAEADKFKKGTKSASLKGKTVALAFFEPSTRTYTSFDVAAKKLEANTVGFRSDVGTSLKKGESFADTIRMLVGYTDCIVIRHSYDGAARFAAQLTDKPVINAGDGKQEHPTQSLIDLYTVRSAFGKVDGLVYGVVGDLKYGRAAHSLLYALTRFKPKRVYMISPRHLRLGDESLSRLNYDYKETDDLMSVAKEIDVLYVTRIQKERFADELEYNKVKDSYRIDNSVVDALKPKSIIMHPLPRVNEIATEVDKSGKARYFEQAANGVPIRMALLNKILG